MDGGVERLVGELLRSHTAYAIPLMVTETAVEGDGDKQCAWVDRLVDGLEDLRGKGLPIVGLTWRPLMDFVDWSWASGGSVVEEFYRRDGVGQRPHPVSPLGAPGGPVEPFLRRMGLYRLEADAAGNLERRPTRALARFRTWAMPSATRPGLDDGSGITNQGASMSGHIAAAPRFLGDGKIIFEERPRPALAGSCCSECAPTPFVAPTAPSTSRGSAVTPGHEAAGVVAAAGPATSVREGTPGVVFLMDYLRPMP